MIRHRSRRLGIESLEERQLLSIAAIGDPFAVGSEDGGTQVLFGQSRVAAVATDADGDYVAVWSGEMTPGSGYDVYGQRFDSAGAPVGSEFRVNENTSSEQKFAGVAMDDEGDFVVTWSSLRQDGSLYGTYARRYDAVGTPLGGEFQVNETTTGNQNYSAVGMDADGDFTIAWTSADQDGDGTGIFARRYSADGTATWDEVAVNETTAGNQRYPVIASDSVGGTVVAWTSDGQDGSSGGIYARRLAPDGTALGGEFQVNTTTEGNQQLPSVAVSPGGNFLIAWQGFDLTAGEWKVYVQAYDATAAPVGAETVVGSGRHASVTVGNGGDFVVAWEAPSAFDSSHKEIHLQHFDPLGNPAGLPYGFQTPDSTLTAPSIALHADRPVVVWTATVPGSPVSNVHGQRTQLTLEGTFNQAPSIVMPGDVTVDAGQLVELNVSATDPDDPPQGLTYAFATTAPAGATLDSVTGDFSWTPLEAHAGRDFEIAVRVTDSGSPTLSDQGSFRVSVNALNQPPVLDPIGNRRVDQLAPISFTVSATDDGLPSASLHFSLAGDVPEGAVIDESSGEFHWTPTEAQAPGVYTFTVAVSDGELGDQEEITITVSVIHLSGGAGDDTFEFTPAEAGGPWHTVTINGNTETYDPSLVDTFRIDGLGGDDLFLASGTGGDDEATLEPGTVDLTGSGYAVHGEDVETIRLGAGSGGTDVASLTGSENSNRLYSYADYSRLTDSARTFFHRIDGFDEVSVGVPGAGRNYAYLYDSPGNDLLAATPELVQLNGEDPSAIRTAAGFDRIYALATNGGDDGATLAGSDRTANRFYSYADHAILTESRRSFYFYTRGFDTVAAESPGTLASYAYFHDTAGDDAFTASPTTASMERPDGFSDAAAEGFARVYAYSSRGGSDSATLTGSSGGGNLLRAFPSYATLTDGARSFYHYARGFRWMTAEGSDSAPAIDRAYLYDSPADDVFRDDGQYGYLEDLAGTTYQNRFRYFDFVYARSSDQGTEDTIDVDADQELAYNLIWSGTW